MNKQNKKKSKQKASIDQHVNQDGQEIEF